MHAPAWWHVPGKATDRGVIEHVGMNRSNAAMEFSQEPGPPLASPDAVVKKAGLRPWFPTPRSRWKRAISLPDRESAWPGRPRELYFLPLLDTIQKGTAGVHHFVKGDLAARAASKTVAQQSAPPRAPAENGSCPHDTSAQRSVSASHIERSENGTIPPRVQPARFAFLPEAWRRELTDGRTEQHPTSAKTIRLTGRPSGTASHVQDDTREGDRERSSRTVIRSSSHGTWPFPHTGVGTAGLREVGAHHPQLPDAPSTLSRCWNASHRCFLRAMRRSAAS